LEYQCCKRNKEDHIFFNWEIWGVMFIYSCTKRNVWDKIIRSFWKISHAPSLPVVIHIRRLRPCLHEGRVSLALWLFYRILGCLS
jgi:hypothetical protein